MKNRLILLNLIISMSIIFIFLILAYFVWHPHSLSYLTNLNESAKVLILVNLIVGPALLMLIYKKDKKNLKFDISAILLLQSLSLSIGMYSIYYKHPVYAVFTIDRFTIVNAGKVKFTNSKKNDLSTLLLSSPKLVFAKMPEDSQKRSDIFLGHVFNGEPDLDGRPEFYEPYHHYTSEVLKKGLNIDDILQVDGAKQELDLFLNKHGGNKNSYAYLPLQANNRDSIWVLDIKTANPIGILHIDPWNLKKSVSKRKKTLNTRKQWLI